MESKKQRKNQGKLLYFVNDGEFYFQKGLKFYEQNQLLKAKRYFERAWKFDGLEPIYACQLASVLSEIGDYEKSNALFKEVVEKHDSTLVECYFFMAHNYAHLGLFSEAKQYVEQYLKEEPYGDLAEEAEELLELLSDEFGQLLQEIFHEDQLIQDYERAFQYLEKGHIFLAKKKLKEILKRYPDFYQGYNHLALIYLYLGNEKLCLSFIQEGLKVSPGNVHSFCTLAIYYRFIGDEKGQKECKKLLINVYPLDEAGQLKVGITLILLGEYERGYEWLKKLAQKGYGNYPSYQFWNDVAFLQKSGKELLSRAKEIPIDRMSYIFSIIIDLPLDERQAKQLVTEKEHISPFVYKVALYQLLESQCEVTQLASLLLLEQEGDEEMYEALKKFCLKDEAPRMMKHLAAMMIFNLKPYESILVRDQGKFETLNSVFDCLYESSKVYDFLHYLNYKWGTLNEEVFRLLLKKTFLFVRDYDKRYANDSFIGLTAAFDYAFQRKILYQHVSQKEIAVKYMMTVEDVKNHLPLIQGLFKK